MEKINSVLIVEDDSIATMMIKRLVSQQPRIQSHQTFSDGQLAFDYLMELKKAGKPLPGLILLDINMPVMDGWELLDAMIEEKITNIKVVMLTSSIDLSDRENAKKYDMVKGFFIKPLTSDKMIEIMEIV